MPDSDSELPAKPQPPPGEPELFRGLLGGDAPPPPPQPPGYRPRKKQRSEMGFFDHLEELRMTIIRSMMAAIVGMAIMGYFFIQFFNVLEYPLVKALGEQEAYNVLISPLQPMAGVTMVFSVSIYGGVILMLPVIAYFVVKFVAPGLTIREKGMLRPALLAALALFFLGAGACFTIMLPAGLKFSYMIDKWIHFKTQWTADSYMSLVIWATLATGLIFEFPLILVILQVLGVISPDTLRGSRRYAIIIIAVVGGLLAPSPDVVSMLMMMTPMLLLYEGSIIVGATLRRRRLAEQARRAAAEDAG